MRVLFLSQIVPYPPHGGVLQRGFHLLREIGRRADVDLLAFVHPDTLPTPTALDESRGALGAFCRTVEYFPLWAKASPLHKAAGLGLSMFSSRPFSMLAHRSPAFAARVRAALRQQTYDVIHVDTLALQQFVDGLDGRTARVLTHHNVESMLMRRRAEVETRPLARWFLERETEKLARWEAIASPQFDVNIMMSNADGEVLARIAPTARRAVVANGVNTEYFTPDWSQETPALVYTGGMNMFANRDAMLFFLQDVWPRVRAVRPDTRMFVVGQDPPPEITRLATPDSGVTVTGYVDDIRPYVRQSAVYVVPLRVGGGTRLKVLDAMAMGKAMVSTSIGCEGIDVRADEHLLVADDPAAFAGATLALLDDPARRQALGGAARRLVEQRYAWEVIGDQLFEAYAEAMAARAAGGAR